MLKVLNVLIQRDLPVFTDIGNVGMVRFKSNCIELVLNPKHFFNVNDLNDYNADYQKA